MAGVGFALRKLAQDNTLLGPLKAHGNAAIIAAGPWLFTVFTMSEMPLTYEVSILFSSRVGGCNEL